VDVNLLRTEHIKMIVWELQELLLSMGCLRMTPQDHDWVDPFNYGWFMEAKRHRIELFLQEQL
jgi:hypothetical protein